MAKLGLDIEQWRTAAEQGDALSQYKLGLCYGNGDGVGEDEAKAVYWLTKSAEQGNPDAKEFLAERQKIIKRGSRSPASRIVSVIVLGSLFAGIGGSASEGNVAAVFISLLVGAVIGYFGIKNSFDFIRFFIRCFKN
jgi:TPR repeat protein